MTYAYDRSEGNGIDGECILCGDALSSPTHEALIEANTGTPDEGTCIEPDEPEEDSTRGKRGTAEYASKRLTAILAEHKEGLPVLAEMAARIDARANGLL
jgi:hypothetical protein